MAKIETIRYQCDVCKEEFKNATDVTETRVPCYGGERNEYYSECNLDLCKECSANIRKIIYTHFAQIQNYYGVHIVNKQMGE